MKKTSYILFCLILIIPAICYSKDNYQLANEKYKQGNYIDALAYYRIAAKESGIDFKLAFNLGVTLYRLQRYDESENFLQKSIQLNPQYGNAYLSLALTQIRLNKLTEARLNLEFLAENASSKQLTNSANKLLERLGNNKPTSIPFTLFTWLGTEDQGYEVAGEPITRKSNNFFEFMALYTKQFNNNYKNGYGLTASIFNISYERNKQYDLFFFNLNLDKRFTKNKFLFKPGLDFSQTYLGSTAYQRSIGINFNAQYKVNKRTKIKSRLITNNIYSLNEKYDYLRGQQAKIRSSIVFKTKYSQTFTSRGELELNKREDINTSTLTSSQSPARIRFELNYKLDYWKSWVYKMKAEFRYSRYPGIYTSTSYNEKREEKRTYLKLGLEKKLSKRISILADYYYTNNQSSIDIFSYRKNQLTLGFSYTN